MTKREFERFNEDAYARKVRELASDLADLVTSGDLTDTEANEWLVAKQEQWKGEGV